MHSFFFQFFNCHLILTRLEALKCIEQQDHRCRKRTSFGWDLKKSNRFINIFAPQVFFSIVRMNGLKPIRWPRNSLSSELRCFEFLFAESRFLAGVGSGAAVGRCQFVIFAFKFFFSRLPRCKLGILIFVFFPFTNAVPQTTRLFRPLYLLSYLLNYHLRLTVLQDYF